MTPPPAPDWTEHSDGDPGITLLQLMTWLVEVLLALTAGAVIVAGWRHVRSGAGDP